MKTLVKFGLFLFLFPGEGRKKGVYEIFHMYTVLQTPEKDEEMMSPCGDINILSRV